jgi:hypothetical protein
VKLAKKWKASDWIEKGIKIERLFLMQLRMKVRKQLKKSVEIG